MTPAHLERIARTVDAVGPAVAAVSAAHRALREAGAGAAIAPTMPIPEHIRIGFELAAARPLPRRPTYLAQSERPFDR